MEILMKAIVYIFILFFGVISLSANQESQIIKGQQLFQSALDEFIKYDQHVVSVLHQINNEKRAHDAIPLLIDFTQERRNALESAKRVSDYLKHNQISVDQLPNFYTILSQYRLETLEQYKKMIAEKGRLDKKNWFGISRAIQQKVQYFAYLTPSYQDKTIKHQDTKNRIEEYRTKTENLADEFLNHLTRITSSETSKQLEPQLATLLKNLQEANDVINLYLYDDFDGGKQLLPGMMKRFYDLNGCLLDEVERIEKNDYYHDSALKEFILSLGFPILHLLAEPVERTDRISLPE